MSEIRWSSEALKEMNRLKDVLYGHLSDMARQRAERHGRASVAVEDVHVVASEACARLADECKETW
jgi:histone H3/H4